MMAGETKTVSFEMGSSFDEAYKGKQGEFEVTVKSIETLNLPEMNEEFFKSYGHETEEELLSAIREMQENNRQAQRMEELRKAVRPQLNEQLQHIDLPQSLLERHEQSLRANHTAEDNTTEDNTAEKDASPEEQEERINQEMESYRENLRINYLVRKTLREAGLNIDEQDLYSRFSNAAAMMGMSPQDLYNHRYGRVLLERFVETLQEEQALNYIIQRKLGELPAENTSAADAPAEAQASSEAVAG
jgi:trigger factor